MPDTKDTDKPQPESEQPTVRLEVRSKSPDGFRRAGRFFGPDPVEDSFAQDVADRLRNETQLFVRDVGAPLKKPTHASPADAKTDEGGDDEKAKHAAEAKAKAEADKHGKHKL
jgi:hypothetical protein